MTSDKLSFLPEDYVERRKEQRTNIICLSLFGVMLVCLALVFTGMMRHRATVRSQSAAMNQAFNEAARRLEQLEKLQQQKSAMLRKAEITRTLVEPVPRTFLLADLINRMPSTLSLLECRVTTKTINPPVTVKPKTSAMAAAAKKDPKAAPPPPPAPRQLVNIAMVGVAPTDVQVAQYMSSIGQSPLVADVSLAFSEEAKVADTVMRKFRVDIALKEKADIRTIEPLLIQRKLKQNPMESSTVSLPAGPSKEPVVGRTQPIAPPQMRPPGSPALSTVLESANEATLRKGGK